MMLNLPVAIVESRQVAPTIAKLTDVMGLGRIAVEVLVRRAEQTGDVEPWPEEDAVSLTPLGAERLRVRIVGTRWRDANAQDPRPRAGKDRVSTIGEADLIDVDARHNLDRLLIDREPSVESMLEHFERREADVAELAERVGTQRRWLRPLCPRIVVGLGLQWGGEYSFAYGGPLPSRPGRYCPVCHGLPLPLAACCSYCDATGVDSRQPRTTGRKRKRKERRAAAAPGPRLARLVELLAAAGLRAVGGG